jgi:MtN3 and saliva related transmembrane protein
MYLITVVGFTLWAAYGIVLGQWPLVVSNSICLLLSGFILAMKLLPGRRKKAVASQLAETVDEMTGSSDNHAID